MLRVQRITDVYVRGKLKDKNVIDLPDYWKDLVDPDSIDVVLTPRGSYQELFVEDIQWGRKVIVKNNAGGPINCSYVVYGERKDVSPNISEYQGLTENDYPGDNDEYIVSGLMNKVHEIFPLVIYQDSIDCHREFKGENLDSLREYWFNGYENESPEYSGKIFLHLDPRYNFFFDDLKTSVDNYFLHLNVDYSKLNYHVIKSWVGYHKDDETPSIPAPFSQ